MDLISITKERKDILSKIEAVKADFQKKNQELCEALVFLNNQEKMAMQNIDLGKINLAEHVLVIEINKEMKLYGDDVETVNDVIKELVENNGRKLFSQYIGTKDYDRWTHQGINWTQYGYGPRHGNTVFTIGINSGLRKAPRELEKEEIEACIYLLNALKNGRYFK